MYNLTLGRRSAVRSSVPARRMADEYGGWMPSPEVAALLIELDTANNLHVTSSSSRTEIANALSVHLRNNTSFIPEIESDIADMMSQHEAALKPLRDDLEYTKDLVSRIRDALYSIG